jgi:hypothetical protein
VRIFSLSIVLIILGACAADAGVTAYPSSYHPRGSDYYENLRSAKIAWLKSNAAALTAELTTDKAALASVSGPSAVQAKESVDRLSARAGEIDAELAVMRGPRDTRQENLLKRNVEGWIGAARRGGNGAQAIRLMRDLEGTGL